MKKVKSAKGRMVDFDLIKIKQMIGSRAPTQDVRARQDFIERKLHRRLKKGAGAAPVRKQPIPPKAEVKVVPKLPGTVESSHEEKLNIPDNTKQRARVPVKKN